jgi:hypothetical protein
MVFEILKTGGIAFAHQRAAQMIHSAPENKYRFHMQVLARAITASGKGRAVEKTHENAPGRAERQFCFGARSRQRAFGPAIQRFLPDRWADRDSCRCLA